MTKYLVTPESAGAEDGKDWARENFQALTESHSIEEIRDRGLLSTGPGEWDDALINSMGRRFVMEKLVGAENTDENWETLGLEWCAAYNEAAEKAAVEESTLLLSRAE